MNVTKISIITFFSQLETPKNVAKAKAKVAKSASKVKEPLESVFPNVFTWATNPKESSVALIKKYISKVIIP